MCTQMQAADSQDGTANDAGLPLSMNEIRGPAGCSVLIVDCQISKETESARVKGSN
jgi:hypothetical protein